MVKCFIPQWGYGANLRLHGNIWIQNTTADQKHMGNLGSRKYKTVTEGENKNKGKFEGIVLQNQLSQSKRSSTLNSPAQDLKTITSNLPRNGKIAILFPIDQGLELYNPFPKTF